MRSVNITIAAIPIVLCIVYIVIKRTSCRRMPHPPGPKAYPVVGNVFDAPSSMPWLAYRKMSADLDSPVVHLDMLGTSVVVVNEREAAYELFWQRSTRYSDRPHLTMLNDVAGYSWTFGFMPSTHPQWKSSRRIFDQHFKESESIKFRPQVMDGVKVVLQQLLNGDSGRRIERQFRFLLVRIVLDVVYGIEVEDAENRFVAIVEAGLDDLDGCVGHDLLEAFPLLQHLPSWMPGMAWKNGTKHWKKHAFAIRDAPFEEVKTGIPVRESIASKLIEQFGDEKEELLSGILATPFSAASDTTAALLHTFILVLILFPSVQDSLANEIDRVVGRDRLPDFNDKASLPYIQAFCWELMRWSCIMPLGLPHRCLEDDLWFNKSDRKSYLIPQGSVVLGNSWAMCNDPNIYANPSEFDPTRFLTPDKSSLDNNAKLPASIFGYGARSCPGRWMAEDVIFACVSSMVSVFTVKRTPESPIWCNNFDELMTPTFVRHPVPFSFRLDPRDKKALDLVI